MRSFNNEELIMSLNKIKSYIDNNAIQIKVELPYIYYKLIAEYDWQILLDLSSLYVNGESVAQQKQIELVTTVDKLSWKYTDESADLARPVAYFKDLQGPAGNDGKDAVIFVPHVSEDGVLSWTNNDNRQNPEPVNIKGDECFIPNDIIINTYTIPADEKAEVKIALLDNNERVQFDFYLPKGKDGTFRTDETYVRLQTKDKTVLGAINEINNKLSQAGPTEERPVDAYVGEIFLDTTLKKPIWYLGDNIWIDYSGKEV